MLANIIRWSLNHPRWILVAFLAVVIFGLEAMTRIPIDAVPDITHIQVVLNTKTGALDPEKIETRVTRPIEVEMTGLPKLEDIRSLSKYGLSQVTLVFEEGTDIYWARQQVAERISNLGKVIPEHLSVELAPITTGLGEVFMYTVETDDPPSESFIPREEIARLTYLRTLQDYTIRPILKRIPGVAEVDSNGGYQKEIHVNFFPKKLEKYGLSVEQLSRHIETIGENFGGGYIQKEDQQIIVRTVPGITRLEDLRVLPVGLDVRGRPILLQDVCEIREDHALRLGAATFNGKEAVLGTVLMRSGANSREVARASMDAVKSLILPKGVHIRPLYSRSFLVQATIQTVAKNLIEGAVLVVLVLVLLLGHLRAAFLVALAIPVSMLGTFLGMTSFGISANLMSLGALDFGLIVDGSVVMIENYLRRKSSSIVEAATEVGRPIFLGLLMIMLVYLPLLSLRGVEGKMFRPMALTVLMALVTSLGVSLILMPVLAKRLNLGRENSAGETKAFIWIKDHYSKVLDFCFQNPQGVGWVALACVIATGLLVPNLGFDFVPNLDEGDLVLNLARNSRQGIDASIRDQKASDFLLSKLPEVDYVFSRIGTPESATDPMGVYLADTFLMLKKNSGAVSSASQHELVNRVLQTLRSGGPPQEISVTQPIEMRFNEMLEGTRADVSLRIIGPSLSTLFDLILEAKESISKVSGFETVEFDPLTALKQSSMLDLEINYTALASHAMSVSQVNQAVEMAMSGKEVGSFFEQAIRFPIRIHLDESLRNNLDAIRNLPVLLPEGGTIPLSSLTGFSIKDRVTTIARTWGERYAAVSVNLAGRDVDSFVKEAQARIQKEVSLPDGYRAQWGGQFKNLQHAKKKLGMIIPATLLVMFLLLMNEFQSLRQTLLILSSVPMAGMGGVFLLTVRKIPLSVSAMVGFIAVSGIVILNGIVLMSVFNQLVASGENVSSAARKGSLLRLRPVLMTALVAGLGFIPMAVNHGLGSEVQRPLATVVIGGICTATLLTLLLLPVAYAGFQKNKRV